MGKGDQRSRKGKIWRGTFGKSRPRGVRKEAPAARPAARPARKASR
jgi:30S ribosomal protein S31